MPRAIAGYVSHKSAVRGVIGSTVSFVAIDLMLRFFGVAASLMLAGAGCGLALGVYRVGTRHQAWRAAMALGLAAGSAMAASVAPGLPQRGGGAADGVLGDGAAFEERCRGRIELSRLASRGLPEAEGLATSRVGRAAKRGGDMVLAAMLLVLMLPLMVLTAIAIACDSEGPVFYREQRLGQFDRPFMMLKFRSMRVDAKPLDVAQSASRPDPLVTRVGRLIRATRIDELPQLVNVLRGEMSLVGPRAERAHFVAQLARAVPFYRQRSYVKPGLTGWAQVNFPSGASAADAREKLAYDLYYVKHRGWLLDLSILLATARLVLLGPGGR